MNPYSLWSLKSDDNISTPQWSVPPDSPRRASKRQKTNMTDGHSDTLPHSPAHQFDDFNSYCPPQWSSSNIREYSVADREVRETEYSKQFVVQYLLPFSSIQDRLLELYFKHIHPMFPIINEDSFAGIYEKYRTRNDLIAPEHFLLLLAISFVAFAVCPINSLDNISKLY